jgi:hypothetical protein
MRKLLVAAAMLVALINSGQAAELPDCDAPETRATFANVVSNWQLLEFKNINSDDPTKKRWCSAFYIGRFGMRSPYMEAVFTLEWMNESEHRFWLQVREAGLSCRGVMGNPFSEERCQ